MSMEAQIRTRLEAAFQPTVLKVENQSARHAGHSGDDGSGESHWHVELTSAQFKGQSRIARHRAVHAALGKEIMATIHALSLDLSEG